MAKNTGKNFRLGAVKQRNQAYNPKNDSWVKIDTGSGKFMDQKADHKPFKGVSKENDGRPK